MKMFRNCTIAALALLAASCFSGYRTEADAKALRVRRGTFASDVVLTGELRAARGEELALQVANDLANELSNESADELS